MQYLDVYSASIELGGATTLITIRTAISLSFWLLFLEDLLECQGCGGTRRRLPGSEGRACALAVEWYALGDSQNVGSYPLKVKWTGHKPLQWKLYPLGEIDTHSFL